MRDEPVFQLQGSYRTMARVAQRVLPVMTDAEVERLAEFRSRWRAAKIDENPVNAIVGALKNIEVALRLSAS